MGSLKVSGFRVKFTLQGGIGVFTSPLSDSLELALQRAADLERGNKATIEGIVEHEGYLCVPSRMELHNQTPPARGIVVVIVMSVLRTNWRPVHRRFLLL